MKLRIALGRIDRTVFGYVVEQPMFEAHYAEDGDEYANVEYNHRSYALFVDEPFGLYGEYFNLVEDDAKGTKKLFSYEYPSIGDALDAMEGLALAVRQVNEEIDRQNKTLQLQIIE